jgi:hypothetical protein
LSPHRPAKRYLYFRFIITYIHAQKSGNTTFTNRVENKTDFWASPGPYLRKSTLISLARNISGCELPPPLLASTTFEKSEFNVSSEEEDEISMTLASQLRDAVIQSAKDAEKDGSENDGSESEL